MHEPTRLERRSIYCGKPPRPDARTNLIIEASIGNSLNVNLAKVPPNKHARTDVIHNQPITFHARAAQAFLCRCATKKYRAFRDGRSLSRAVTLLGGIVLQFFVVRSLFVEPRPIPLDECLSLSIHIVALANTRNDETEAVGDEGRVPKLLAM